MRIPRPIRFCGLIAIAGASLLALPALASASGVAYVTNEGGNTISQYGIASNGGLSSLSPATVGGAGGPFGIAVSPDGASVYSANFGAASVSQFDVQDGGTLSPKSPATAPAGTGANGVAISPDGASLYVTNANDASISQYDVGADGTLSPKSASTVFSGLLAFPLGIVVSPDGASVYAGNLGAPTISQYDVGADGTLSPKSPSTAASGTATEAIAISPDGTSLYAANTGDNNVGQYDVGTGGKLSPKTPATVPAGDEPAGITVSPDGASVYAPNQGDNSVSQFNIGAAGALSPKSPATVAAGRAPGGLTISPDAASLYVANFKPTLITGFNSVSQYDISADGTLTPKTSPTAATQGGPNSIAVLPEAELAIKTRSSRRPGNLRVKVTCDGAPCTATISGAARIPSDRARGDAATAGPKTKRFQLATKQSEIEIGETRNLRLKFTRNSRAVKRITSLLRTTKRANRAKLIVRVRAAGPANFITKERERIRLAL